MQLFNTDHYAGPLLYFDLDVVITRNIDWIWQLDLQHFWAVRDFKYLWRPTSYNINSSIMRWDTRRYGHIYEEFVRKHNPHPNISLESVIIYIPNQRIKFYKDFSTLLSSLPSEIYKELSEKNKSFEEIELDIIKDYI
jgi:hypothetical protein